MLSHRFHLKNLFAAVVVVIGCCAPASDGDIDLDDDDDTDTKAEYTLTIEGTCPGEVKLHWSGAGEGKQQGLVMGSRAGKTTIPVGQPCVGTVLGIAGDVKLVDPPGFFSTRKGSGLLIGQLPASVCGHHMQLLKAGACKVSNVAVIPAESVE